MVTFPKVFKIVPAALCAVALFISAASAAGPGISGGPMLQQPRPTSIIVSWFTRQPSLGTVTLTAGGRRFAETNSTTDHSVKISGLLPDTAYAYTVSSDSEGVLATGTFRSAPALSSMRSLRIAALGDSGMGDANQFGVASVLGGMNPRIIIHTGDIVYPAGEFSGYEGRFFEPYSVALSSAPILPSVGNHDALHIDEGYRRVFSPPSPRSAAKRYYAQRFGMIEFVAIDSALPVTRNSPQGAWLRSVLQSSQYRGARWHIVFFHFPMFSAGAHGSTVELQRSLAPLLESGGVDLVLNGHDHDYERTGPVNLSGKGVAVTYVVTGGGGAALYDRGYDEPRIKKFEKRHHLLQLRVSATALVVEALGADGKKFDSFTLRPRRRSSR